MVFRSLNTGLPVDENTLFGIASNRKAFTAFALGILVDEGKISWDDKVSNLDSGIQNVQPLRYRRIYHP